MFFVDCGYDLAWGRADAVEPDRRPLVAVPIVAAFVMTQWDMVIDPPQSTISKAWIWHEGGAHFGVPLSNHLGWLLTSWLFYQVFALYLNRRRYVSAWSAEPGRALRLVAILLYLGSGLTHVTPWLVGQSGEVADAANQVWRIEDLREATVVILLFTMVFTSMLVAACDGQRRSLRRVSAPTPPARSRAPVRPPP